MKIKLFFFLISKNSKVWISEISERKKNEKKKKKPKKKKKKHQK